jgi:tetrahydromethanopterin S-methyltransferase subunit G
METFKDKLKKIQELLDSNHITKDDYYKLRGEILEEEEEEEEEEENENDESINKLNKKLKKNQQSQNLNIQRIKKAGSNVIGIYYLIIFEIILNQIYNILFDVKIEYLKKTDGISNSYSEINKLTEFILNMDKIDDFIKKLKYLDVIFNTLQLILFLIFLSYFWNLGKNLKNVDKNLY